MSKIGNQKDDMMTDEERILGPSAGLRSDPDPVSNCCGAVFEYQGWPDNDICSKCGEHAGIEEEGIETKDHLGSLAEEFMGLKKSNKDLDAEKKKNSTRISELESHIIDLMQSQELEKISTSVGTLSVKIAQHAQFDNDNGGSETFFEWVAKTKAWEYLYKRVNSAPVRQMLKTSGVLPPGVTLFEKAQLNTRIKPTE